MPLGLAWSPLPRVSHRLAIVALGVMGCGLEDHPPIGYCTAVASIAVEVSVTDSVSGRPLADSAQGTVQAGSYTDVLHFSPASPTLMFGGTRLGTYDVSLTRPGYAPWSRTGVRVTQTGTCGNVVPEQLAALLQPSP